MRIVHYIDGLDPRLGGIVRAVSNIVDCQQRLLDVTLLVRQRQDDASDLARVVEVCGSRLPGGTLTPSTLRRASQVLNHADVLHLHNVWSPANMQLAAITRRGGARVVLSSHGALDAWPLRQKRIKKQAYLTSLGRLLLRNVDVVHTTCEREATSVRAAVRGGKVAVVPLPLDAESYRTARLGVAAGAVPTPAGRHGISVVFVGRLHEKKRVDRAVGALAVLLANGRPATLTIMGTGAPSYESYIRGLVRSRGLDAYARILGFVSEAQRRQLLADAEVAIVPSEHENFGFVCFEALAAGTPLVTVPGVMTHQELRDSGAAVVCDGSQDGLADAIVTAVDGDARQSMGQMGQRWILTAFDPATLARRYADMYRSACAAHQAAPAFAG